MATNNYTKKEEQKYLRYRYREGDTQIIHNAERNAEKRIEGAYYMAEYQMGICN